MSQVDALMRCWKLPNGDFLVPGMTVPWEASWIVSIRLPNNKVIRCATQFYRISPNAQIIATYGGSPTTYSLEDTLYIYDFCEVIDGQLCRLMWQQQRVEQEKIEILEVKLTGLTACLASELPFEQTLGFFKSEL